MIAPGKLSVAATVMLRAFAGAIPVWVGPRHDPTAGHRYRRNQRRRDERRTGARR